jgi:hypothetical protein
MSWREGKPKVALLWDESFLWGVVSYKALKGAGLPFRLIRADDVRAGVLTECAALFVPGGWASNKIRALGELGVSSIRQFVKEGGTYRLLRRSGTGHKRWVGTSRCKEKTNHSTGTELRRENSAQAAG